MKIERYVFTGIQEYIFIVIQEYIYMYLQYNVFVVKYKTVKMAHIIGEVFGMAKK